MEAIQYIIAIVAAFGIPTAATNYFLRKFETRQNLRDTEERKREALREEAREQSTLLIIQGVGAAIALSEATAKAVRDGKCNGEMTDALKYAQNAKHQQKDFLAKQAVKNLID